MKHLSFYQSSEMLSQMQQPSAAAGSTQAVNMLGNLAGLSLGHMHVHRQLMPGTIGGSLSM